MIFSNRHLIKKQGGNVKDIMTSKNTNPGTTVWKRTSRKHKVLRIVATTLNFEIFEGMRTKLSNGTNIFSDQAAQISLQTEGQKNV